MSNIDNSKFAQALLRRREEATKRASQISANVSKNSEQSYISNEEPSIIDQDNEISIMVDEDQELFQIQRENQELKAKIRDLMQQNKTLAQKIDDLLDHSEIDMLTEQISNLEIELTNEKNQRKQAEDRLLYLQYQYDIKCKESAANMKILESLQLKNRKLQEQNSSLYQSNMSQLDNDQYSNASRFSRNAPESPRRNDLNSPRRNEPSSPRRFQDEPERYQVDTGSPKRPKPEMRSSNSSLGSQNPADMETVDINREIKILETRKVELEDILDETFDNVDPNIQNQYNRLLTRLSQLKRELRFRS